MRQIAALCLNSINLKYFSLEFNTQFKKINAGFHFLSTIHPPTVLQVLLLQTKVLRYMHCVAQSEAKGKSSTSLLPLLLGHGFPALNNKKCAVSYFFYNFPIQLLLSLTLCAIGIALLLLLVEDNRVL